MPNDKRTEHGFPVIGSPSRPRSTSADSSELIPPPPPQSSATTGARSPAIAASSSIGQPLSAIASGTKLHDEAHRLAVLPEHLATASIEALRARYFGELVRAETAWIDGDVKFWGYRRVGTVIWPKGSAESCLAELAPMLEPAGAKTIAAELLRLSSLTVPRREGEVAGELRAMAYAEELSRYPADVVIWACREWPRSGAQGSFFPAWAELRALCERRVERRRGLADLCRATLERLGATPLALVPGRSEA